MTTAVLDTNAVSYLWRGVHDGQYDKAIFWHMLKDSIIGWGLNFIESEEHVRA
jgi:hypothetical protein